MSDGPKKRRRVSIEKDQKDQKDQYDPIQPIERNSEMEHEKNRKSKGIFYSVLQHCSRCGKIMLFNSKSIFCKDCETIVRQEKEARYQAEEERKRQEEERRRQAEEERKRLEEEKRRQAEEERKRLEEEKRWQAEEEEKCKQAEVERKMDGLFYGAVVDSDGYNADGRSRQQLIKTLYYGALLSEGRDVELRPEKWNPFNPGALAVYCSGIQIGYLEQEAAEIINNGAPLEMYNVRVASCFDRSKDEDGYSVGPEKWFVNLCIEFKGTLLSLLSKGNRSCSETKSYDFRIDKETKHIILSDFDLDVPPCSNAVDGQSLSIKKEFSSDGISLQCYNENDKMICEIPKYLSDAMYKKLMNPNGKYNITVKESYDVDYRTTRIHIQYLWKGTKAEAIDLLTVGDSILFGSFPQDSLAADPVEWFVVDSDDGIITLVTKNVLDSCEFIGQTWYDSNLRRMLNNEYYNYMFNESQKQLIVAVPRSQGVLIKYDSDEYQSWISEIIPNSGSFTCDKMTILSFLDLVSSINKNGNGIDIDYKTHLQKGIDSKMLSAMQRFRVSYWWLRDECQFATAISGKTNHIVCQPTSKNSIGFAIGRTEKKGIRPAISIDRNKL